MFICRLLNTYAPLSELKEIYEAAIDHPQVVGLSLGTRPDCIDEEKLAYLQTLTKKYEIVIEYGMESIKDETLAWINRCHTFDEFKQAIKLTKIYAPDVLIASHVIIGFPVEDKQDWLEMADVVSTLDINFLKLHQLHVVKNTVLAKMYIEKPFKTLTLQEYLDVVVEVIERLNPSIVLQRVFGQTLKQLLIAPHYTEGDFKIGSHRFMEMVNEKLAARGSVQGTLFGKSESYTYVESSL
ncbi:MAG: TIGR01212 family radical SAM protein [Bacteriovoracaceae bacterium]